MDFEFSADQKLIQEQVRSVLSEQSTPDHVRSILDSDTPFHRQLWQQATDLGWTATRIPEEYGGLGLGYLELAVIAEELGRSLAPIPFSSSVYLATEALLLAGSEEQKQQYLPKLASGELIGTFALAEVQGEVTADNQLCQVKDGKLHGFKLPVADGDVADFIVLGAQEKQGYSAYIVDLNAAGIDRQVLKTIDPSRSHARLEFKGTPVTALGNPGDGAALFRKLQDIAAVLFAFEQIGGAQAALDMGIEYTKNRYAFGRQIASFQAIKHKLADMFTALELARSNAYYGAWALSLSEDGSSPAELPLAAATARVSATDAYFLSAKESLQAHGGMGFTWEFNCHLYYRRAQLLALNLGGQPQWKNLLVERLITSDIAA